MLATQINRECMIYHQNGEKLSKPVEEVINNKVKNQRN